ncbi:response regulator [Aquincola sp. S2]|uniref:histidine kinase n=1 Tax=Pseudaquabacterium terrae TaxID=2732868 RepID=A0ABX2EHT0_9BURK|nr:ATP-binding protein [Aquabacterium terrae]NRF68168.1 response regulator [Aquabacterium terrae]
MNDGPQRVHGLPNRWFDGWRRAAAWRGLTVSLRSYLVALMLLATVPIAALMSLLILDDVRAGDRRLQQELERHAGALALAIERELESSIESLQTLGQTEALRQWEMRPLPSAGADWARLRSSWSRLVVRAPGGQALYDSAGPDSGPPGDPAAFARVLQTRTVQVSPLLTEPRTGRPATLILVPVVTEGQPRQVLTAWIDAAHWVELLQRAGAPPDGYSALYDSRQQLIASSGQAAAAHAPLSGWARQASGVQRSQQVDGVALTAWQRLPLADWGIVVGHATAAAEAAQRRTILATVATAAACLLLGVALALALAGRITRPLQALARRGARRPADEPSGHWPDSGSHSLLPVREITLLTEAVQRAEQDQQQARARLQNQADEFQTLFASSPIGLALAQDARCDAVLHNAEMERLLGPAHAPGEGAVRVLHRGAPLQRAELPLQRAAASGQPVAPVELELIDAAGVARHAIAQAVPLLDADGRPRGAIAALTDITARKASEALVADADRRLRENLRLMELAQEAGNVGFFVYRFDSHEASWTPGHARLFALDDPSGRSIEVSLDGWLQRIHADDRAPLEQALRRMLAATQTQETLEFRVVAGSAAPRWLSSRMQASYDAAGRPLQVVGVTVDISDQKAAEQAAVALNEREQRARHAAEAANRAKDEFLAMFGHELRNPLSGIASAIEVLNQAPNDSPLAVSAREVIARQTRHLTHLMDDLLDVGRVVSGKVLLTRKAFDLAALVQRLVDGLKITGEAAGHQLHTSLETVWVKADATRIAQVASNLLTNALKYTPAGRSIDVIVQAQPASGERGPQALLQVRDEGDGIASELLPHIFDLFVQGERTLDRRAGGLGIGLTLVRRLVEQHGGRVTAESSPRGSVFSVWLDAVPAHAEAQPAGQLPAPQRRRVLIIEDNADAANSLRALLELDGHQVEIAVDGPGGLQALLAQRPDAAVVDIGLPGLNGFDLARESRGAGYAGMMVALTGYGQGTDIKRALKSGFDAHLVKPLDAERLRRLLVEGPGFG